MGSRFRWAVMGLLGALAVGLAVPAVRHWREVPPQPPPTVRLALTAPAGASLGFSDDLLDAAITSDGRTLAFVATRDGIPRLWQQRLSDGDTKALEGTDGAQLPTWNPAGDTLAFFASGQLKTLTIGTGAIRDVADVQAPSGVSWLPDGTLLVGGSLGQPIARIANGAARPHTVLAPGDRQHLFPAAYGAAGDFVYVAIRDNGQRMIRTVGADGERELGATSAHVEVAHERILHVLDGTLVAEPLARERPRPTNPNPRVPRAVLATGVGVSASGRGLFASSARILVYAAAAPRSYQLEWLDPVSGAVTAIRDPGEYWRLRLSPAGTYAAVTVTEPLLRTLDVVALPTGPRGYAEKVSLALAPDTDPVWSPDSTRLVFRSLQSGAPTLFVRPAHRAEVPPAALPASAVDYTPTDWRGRRILAHASTGKSGQDLWDLDDATLAGRAIVASGFNETDGRWSVDGRWIAYVSDESGRPDIYALRLADNVRIRVSFAGGTQPRWGRDGRTLYFVRDGRVMRSELQDGSRPAATAASQLGDLTGVRDLDVSRASDRLLVLVPTARVAAPPVTAMVDWATLLSQPVAPR